MARVSQRLGHGPTDCAMTWWRSHAGLMSRGTPLQPYSHSALRARRVCPSLPSPRATVTTPVCALHLTGPSLSHTTHNPSSSSIGSPTTAQPSAEVTHLVDERDKYRADTELLHTTPAEHGSPSADGDGDEGDANDWPEPTLEDLDRSIPQVDCEFIANLIRRRNLQRDEFLRTKEAVKAKAQELTQAQVGSVDEVPSLRSVGGLFSWKGVAAAASGEGDALATSSSGDASSSSVMVSDAVLAQLSAEEQDILRTARPHYHDGFILLDCRTVNEVTSWGIIEGAKVLPAHELFEAFHATPEDFQASYGFPKPRPDEMVICYCQYGPRSLMAAQLLSWMGYLKVLHLRDGYYEWGKQYNLLLRRWMEHDRTSGNELRRLATFRAALELQREIAPEFNALPMTEAAGYLVDSTRSRGTLRIGEGLRAEAYAKVAKLVEGMEPTALPGVLDSNSSSSAAASSAVRPSLQGQIEQFLENATGLNTSFVEEGRAGSSAGIGEVQDAVLQGLSHISPTSRRGGGSS